MLFKETASFSYLSHSSYSCNRKSPLPPSPSSYLAWPHIPVMRDCLLPTFFAPMYFSTVFLNSYSRNAGSPPPTSAFCSNVSASLPIRRPLSITRNTAASLLYIALCVYHVAHVHCTSATVGCRCTTPMSTSVCARTQCSVVE